MVCDTSSLGRSFAGVACKQSWFILSTECRKSNPQQSQRAKVPQEYLLWPFPRVLLGKRYFDKELIREDPCVRT